MPKWTGYYDAIGDEPARSTLLRALDHWNGPTGVALDLGCGTGPGARLGCHCR
ncbi:hypothetical protein [Pseudomonas luteola]|uniref:hypothetical protein n=1 Tax=Pseudomonas luteola TaxID=47886 RepID=UPI0021ADAA82|nr:hypothetical protein [Pseudomonas luteola]